MTFECEADTLFGTVDIAPGTTGVLIVSGGNEVRCGAHRGMAMLAQALSAAGVPAFRFDRRGIGDSEGENRGYASSGPDIAAALAAFRREQPHVARVIGFGNCDAAIALLLHDAGPDALVLANPWLGEENASLPPSALRRHYLRRAMDRDAWQRLLSRSLSCSLKMLAGVFVAPTEQPLAAGVSHALRERPVTIVLADGDRTAQVFAAAIQPPPGTRVVRIATASHSFVGQGDALVRLLLDTASNPPRHR